MSRVPGLLLRASSGLSGTVFSASSAPGLLATAVGRLTVAGAEDLVTPALPPSPTPPNAWPLQRPRCFTSSTHSCSSGSSSGRDSNPSAAAASSGNSPTTTSSSSSSSDGREELFVGGYTPITKKLWTERRRQAQSAASAAPGAAPAEAATGPAALLPDGRRAPQDISVVYNFSSDKALLDMVRRG